MGDTLSKEEKAKSRIRAELTRLHSKRVAGISGRHVYVQDAMNRVTVLTAGRAAHEQLHQRQRVMRTHGRHWHSLSAQVKHDFEKRAVALQHSRENDIQTRMDALHHEFEQQQQAQQLALQRRSDSMMLSACHLSQADLETLTAVAGSDSLAGQKAETMQRKKLVCPDPIDGQTFAHWQQTSDLHFGTPHAMGPLLKEVARRRDYFSKAVFILGPESDDAYHYRFVFASLQPLQVSLLPLVPLEVPELHPITDRGSWDMHAMQALTHAWGYEVGLVETHDVFEDWPLEDVAVVMHSTFKAGGVLVTQEYMLPLCSVLRGIPVEPKKETSTKMQREGNQQKVPTTEKLPGWLAHSLAGAARSTSSGSTASAAPQNTETEQADDTEAPVLDPAEAAFASVFEELDHERDVLDADPLALLADDFRWTLLGGEWQVQRTGRQVYGIRVDIKAHSPLHNFAVRFKLPRSSSFERNVYGSEGGQALAQLWSTRVSGLFLHWQSHHEPVVFPRDSVTPLEVPDSLRAACDALGPRGQKRLQTILELCPA